MTATVPMFSTVVYQVSEDLLDKLIIKAEEKGFEKGQKKPIEKPLTREEAAKYLRIDPTTLDRRFRNRKYPLSLRHSCGGTSYFFASELESFIKKS